MNTRSYPSNRRLNVLLVEDNPAHAEMVKRCFQGHQIQGSIDHVEDGQSAMDYLRGHGAYARQPRARRPDVVLLDLRLPRVDGLEVLRTIKTNDKLKSIPVVILTTSGAANDVETAYEEHANSYLVKPIDFEQFSKLIDDLGDYWLGWNYPATTES